MPTSRVIRAARILLLILATSNLLATQALAAPNLIVRIEGVVTPTDGEYAFPATVVGESRQLVVVLRNEGSEELLFPETPPILLGGQDESHFSLIQPALETGAKLSPNGSTAFAVRFEPAQRSPELIARVFVFTNASAAPFTLTVSGAALAPEMEVRLDGSLITNGAPVRFSSLSAGESEQQVIVLRNGGNAPLLFMAEPIVGLTGPDADQFAVIQPALESGSLLSPNGSTAFAIRYLPTETPSGAHTAEVRIETNDPAGPFLLSVGSVAVGTESTNWGRLKGRF